MCARMRVGSWGVFRGEEFGRGTGYGECMWFCLVVHMFFIFALMES